MKVCMVGEPIVTMALMVQEGPCPRARGCVDVPASVPGPTADLTLLKQSGLLGRLPPDCAAGGDLGYPGLDALHPHGHIPRRKPRPPEDVAYTRRLPDSA
jgi:hypothetical protein